MTDLDLAHEWLNTWRGKPLAKVDTSLAALLNQVRTEAVEEALVEIANIHDVGHPPWEHCGCALAAAIRARSESKETPA